MFCSCPFLVETPDQRLLPLLPAERGDAAPNGPGGAAAERGPVNSTEMCGAWAKETANPRLTKSKEKKRKDP